MLKTTLILTKFFAQSIFFSSKDVISLIYGSLLTLFIFFMISPQSQNIQTILAITINTMIFFSYIVINLVLNKPLKDGWLKVLYTSGIRHFSVYLVQIAIITIINFCAMLIMTICGSLIACGIIDLQLIKACALIAPIMSVILLLISMLTCANTCAIMQYILSIPLLLPVIICGCGSLEYKYFDYILIGINMVYIPLFFMLSCFCIKVILKS